MDHTCKECFYRPACEVYAEDVGADPDWEALWPESCGRFKDRAKIVELPCRVGDKVYCVLHMGGEIVEDVVEDFDVWSIKNGIKVRLTLQTYKDYVVGEFGKSVFLTRAEAEKALAARGGNYGRK